MTITEQDVLDSWAKWGDGKPLVPGFAKWLAAELSKPIFAPIEPFPHVDIEAVKVLVDRL